MLNRPKTIILQVTPIVILAWQWIRFSKVSGMAWLDFLDFEFLTYYPLILILVMITASLLFEKWWSLSWLRSEKGIFIKVETCEVRDIFGNKM